MKLGRRLKEIFQNALKFQLFCWVCFGHRRMSNYSFNGARLKLERAKYHIDDLNSVCANFFQRNFRLIFSSEPYTFYRTIGVKNDAPIPDQFLAILGDAIHNLRSSLDVLVYAVVNGSGKSFNEKAISFPFRDDADPIKLEARIMQACIHFSVPEAVNLFKSFEPYPGGNLQLRELNEIENIDKHRIPLTTVALFVFLIWMLCIQNFDKSHNSDPILHLTEKAK